MHTQLSTDWRCWLSSTLHKSLPLLILRSHPPNRESGARWKHGIGTSLMSRHARVAASRLPETGLICSPGSE